MKYVKQIGIILGVTLAGEALSHFLPFPVPAGVYGLFLMLTAVSAYYCHVNGDRHGSYGNSGPENGGERK